MRIYNPRITYLRRWRRCLVLFFASAAFAGCAGDKETITQEEVMAGGEETPPGPRQEEIDAAMKAKEEAETLARKKVILARLVAKPWEFQAAVCPELNVGYLINSDDTCKNPTGPNFYQVVGDSNNFPSLYRVNSTKREGDVHNIITFDPT